MQIFFEYFQVIVSPTDERDFLNNQRLAHINFRYNFVNHDTGFEYFAFFPCGVGTLNRVLY